MNDKVDPNSCTVILPFRKPEKPSRINSLSGLILTDQNGNEDWVLYEDDEGRIRRALDQNRRFIEILMKKANARLEKGSKLEIRDFKPKQI